MTKTMKLFSCISTFIAFLAFKHHENLQARVEIQGVVISADAGLPLENIYLYTKEGEEEALTNKKGEFKLTTWQHLPVTLTIEHLHFEKQTRQVSDVSKPIVIILRKK
jgi:hypothetical protein